MRRNIKKMYYSLCLKLNGFRSSYLILESSYSYYAYHIITKMT